MIIGVDVDNTLLCWDDAFHQAASAEGLIAADVPRTKSAVKASVVTGAGEEAWTRLQGRVYGQAEGARAFDGAREALTALRTAGASVVLVSHKTPRSVLGPPYDLVAAARRVLEQARILGDGCVAPEDAWFEPTLDEKLARIGGLGCDVFVDDLPSVLTAARFPAGTLGVLFDPAGGHPDHRGQRATDWATLTDLVLELLRAPA